MRKLFAIVVAMAMLGFGGVAMAGGGGNGGENVGDKAKFDSEITLRYDPGPSDPYDPYYEQARFYGKVTVSPANKEAENNPNAKQKCLSGRTVIIKNKSLPSGEQTFATAVTDENGRYEVEADGAYSEPGEYQAKVKKKRKVKAEVKCFAAKSNFVTVP